MLRRITGRNASQTIQKIFNLLNMHKKLKIIKYNSQIQNIINININTYRTYSGKFVVVYNNEKIREFSSINGELLYEGEYLNGYKNGYGKEYE